MAEAGLPVLRSVFGEPAAAPLPLATLREQLAAVEQLLVWVEKAAEQPALAEPLHGLLVRLDEVYSLLLLALYKTLSARKSWRFVDDRPEFPAHLHNRVAQRVASLWPAEPLPVWTAGLVAYETKQKQEFGQERTECAVTDYSGLLEEANWLNPAMEDGPTAVAIRNGLKTRRQDPPRTQVERVSCARCGAKILPSTARRTGGLCAPCAHGKKKGSVRRDGQG